MKASKGRLGDEVLGWALCSMDQSSHLLLPCDAWPNKFALLERAALVAWLTAII